MYFRVLTFAFLLCFFTFVPRAASAACVNPVGEAGTIIYDAESAAMQYCNGAGWVAFLKPGQGALTPPTSGYFVATSASDLAVSSNMGGLAGANAECLLQLESSDWLGKAGAMAAGQLHAENVRAWLCDNTACQNMASSTSYRLASTIDPAVGGFLVTSTANGYYPDDGNGWNGGSAFGQYLEIVTGRGTNNLPFNNRTCNNWTTATGNMTVGVTDTGFYPERLFKFTRSCASYWWPSNTSIVCMVGLQQKVSSAPKRINHASVKNTSTANLTSPSFTPGDNSLLVAVVSGVTNDSNGTSAPNPVVSGGSLTWTRRAQAREESAGDDGWWAFSEIWTAPVVTGASMSATLALSRSVDGKALNVYEYFGYRGADPIGATASATREGAVGPWTINLSDTPAESSEIMATVVANNWTINDPIKRGSGWLQIYKDVNLGSETKPQIQIRAAPTSTAIQWNDVYVDNPNQPAVATAVEIKAASCVSPAEPAGKIIYNGDDRVLQWCDGMTWRPAGPIDPPGPNGSCTSPAKPGGYLMFASSTCQIVYCDGNVWRGIGTPYTLADNLAAYWMFNESSGTAADSTGNGNTGTVTSGTWTPAGGHNGGALEFNGTTTVVNAGSGATIDDLGPQSVSVWIYPRSHGEGNNAWIVGKGTGTDLPTNGWLLGMTNDFTRALRFAVHHNTAHLEYVTDANAVTFNQWNHVTVTWNGSTAANSVDIKVNGVSQSYSFVDVGAGARLTDAAQTMYIGNNSAGSRTFDGFIDDLRVYSRVLSAAEIGQLYFDSGGMACK